MSHACADPDLSLHVPFMIRVKYENCAHKDLFSEVFDLGLPSLARSLKNSFRAHDHIVRGLYALVEVSVQNYFLLICHLC